MNVTSETIVKALIINEAGEALVLTLGEHLARPDRSYLPDLPGGVRDEAESKREATAREVQEECGITLEPRGLRLVYANTNIYEDEMKSVTRILYAANLDNTPEVTLSWEHSDHRWVSLDELSAIDFRSFSEAVNHALSNNLIRQLFTKHSQETIINI